MKITDFLNESSISVDLKATEKQDVINELVDLLVTSGQIKAGDKDSIVPVLLAREELGSTGIGQGVGIPHGKTNSVDNLIGAFGVSREGVNFDSLDGEPVNLFFLLVAPEESAGPHLKALARISRLLKDRFFRDSLKAAKAPEDVIRVIQQEDQKNG